MKEIWCYKLEKHIDPEDNCHLCSEDGICHFKPVEEEGCWKFALGVIIFWAIVVSVILKIAGII